MVRLLKSLAVAMALAGATLISSNVQAQSNSSSPLPSPTATSISRQAGTPAPTPQSGDNTGTISSTLGQSQSVTATSTVTSAEDALLLPTPTALPGAEGSASLTTTIDSSSESAPLEGTILTNRSEVVARFFVEGETYQLAAGRSQGLQLPRSTTVLNLFNCDGELAVDTAGCFWDPYMIQQDGFYEIYNAANSDDEIILTLREAGAPPGGLVWVQNRTGQTESVVFKEDIFEIQPTSVLEFPVATGVPAILYVRSCLTVDGQSACEWAPRTLNAGVYYAMLEVDTPGTQAGSSQVTIDLRPVVGEGEEAAASEVSTAAPSIVCSVVVPALNIRSGPGLQYDIIGKVRTGDGSPGTVSVTGRSADNEWLTVEESVAVGGWINNSPSFITCSSDVLTLPVVEAPAPPTPQPAANVETPADTTATITEGTQVAESPSTESAAGTDTGTESGTTSDTSGTAESAPTIPEGQALLVINNGFQHEMRFTLDQMYRVQDGPSEFDLQPGQSLSIVVYPGNIPFTASTPWSGLSSNASLQIEPNQSMTLWLRFEPEPGGNWVFRWN